MCGPGLIVPLIFPQTATESARARRGAAERRARVRHELNLGGANQSTARGASDRRERPATTRCWASYSRP